MLKYQNMTARSWILTMLLNAMVSCAPELIQDKYIAHFREKAFTMGFHQLCYAGSMIIWTVVFQFMMPGHMAFAENAGLPVFSEDLLRRHYHNIKRIEALIEQKRYSSYLEEPFVSNIKMVWTADDFIWKVISPVQYELKYRMSKTSEVDELISPGSKDVRNEMAIKIIRMIGAMMRADFTELRKYYDVKINPFYVECFVREKQNAFAGGNIKLFFHEDLNIKKVVIGDQSDRSELYFNSIKINRNQEKND